MVQLVLKKSEVLLIDATVIIGILILLSITTISLSTFPETPRKDPCEYNSILPTGWDNPIFLVSWVMGAFSVSALIEIVTLLYPLWGKRKAKGIHSSIPGDGPENAAPSSLIAMGVGFAWLVITLFIFAIDAFGKLASC